MVIVGWRLFFDQFWMRHCDFVPEFFICVCVDDSTEIVRIWLINFSSIVEFRWNRLPANDRFDEQNRSVTVDWAALHSLSIIDLAQRVDPNMPIHIAFFSTLIFLLNHNEFCGAFGRTDLGLIAVGRDLNSINSLICLSITIR